MSNMKIDDKELREEERLEWLARHRQEDARDDTINAIYWDFEATNQLPIDLRKYPADPAADDHDDMTQEEEQFCDDHYDWSATQWRSDEVSAFGCALLWVSAIILGIVIYIGWYFLASHGYFWWLQ